VKTLLLGGYGNFGARIGRALAAEPGVELMIGGRNGARAGAFAATLGATMQGVAIDATAGTLAQLLQRQGVQLVIHAAGPFQPQGYGVAEAAARAGAHYIDLADGRRFVCDFPAALDATFRAAGRVGVSGASTVPALSSAVVDALTAGWRSIHHIDIAIAPAQTAPRGAATLASVLASCGEPIAVWHAGRWQTQRGWAELQPVHFHRLRPRLGALCDIPDLELFPARYGTSGRVMFRAALEVALQQRALALLAALRRLGALKQPARLARPLNRMAALFDRFGSSLGGMVVRIDGESEGGQPLRREWHIAADHDHGPEIPCMAAILLARRLASGAALPSGAHVCMGLLRLADFTPEFTRWGMLTDVLTQELPRGAPAL
jgi:saccharopine dehydrogenase-like NADP-dependent oxidoreductase